MREAPKRLVALAASLALVVCAAARGAQGQAAPAEDAETRAVRKAVETYLYAEDSGQKEPVSDAGAKIFHLDPQGRAAATPLSRRGRKLGKGEKVLRSPQRIASIEVLNDAASVKVGTDFTPDERADESNTHYQLIWLLKVKGEWKIVGILMPTPALPGASRE